MKKRRTLKDPPPEEWEEGYREEIHALIFLADNDLTVLDGALSRFTDQLQPLTEKLTVEHGRALARARRETGHRAVRLRRRHQPALVPHGGN